MAIGPAPTDATRSDRHGGADRDAALQRASLALGHRRPQEAERIASEILRGDPNDIRALETLGHALLAQNRGAEAIAPLETAGRSKQHPEIDTALAVALRQAGRTDEALSRLRHTAKRHPRFAAVYRELGALLFALDRLDEAIDALKRGIAVAPMMPELSIQLGYVFLHRRDCRNARAAFKHALGIAPNSAEALFGIAKTHQEVGENQAAADYFRRYLLLRPADANAWLTLGDCLLELGQRQAGYDCFRSVVRHHPERYGDALGALVRSGRGRFWLRPSAAADFFRGQKG
jgi:tetratricopeptide (TPR) repeat protein